MQDDQQKIELPEKKEAEPEPSTSHENSEGSSNTLDETSNEKKPLKKKRKPPAQSICCTFSDETGANPGCKQRAIMGYKFCIRHILMDPDAPYKRCEHVKKPKKKSMQSEQCTNAVKLSEASNYCSTHLIMQGLKEAKKKKQPKEASREASPEKEKLDEEAAPSTSASQSTAYNESDDVVIASMDCGPVRYYKDGIGFDEQGRVDWSSLKDPCLTDEDEKDDDECPSDEEEEMEEMMDEWLDELAADSDDSEDINDGIIDSDDRIQVKAEWVRSGRKRLIEEELLNEVERPDEIESIDARRTDALEKRFENVERSGFDEVQVLRLLRSERREEESSDDVSSGDEEEAEVEGVHVGLDKLMEIYNERLQMTSLPLMNRKKGKLMGRRSRQLTYLKALQMLMLMPMGELEKRMKASGFPMTMEWIFYWKHYLMSSLLLARNTRLPWKLIESRPFLASKVVKSGTVRRKQYLRMLIELLSRKCDDSAPPIVEHRRTAAEKERETIRLEQKRRRMKMKGAYRLIPQVAEACQALEDEDYDKTDMFPLGLEPSEDEDEEGPRMLVELPEYMGRKQARLERYELVKEARICGKLMAAAKKFPNAMGSAMENRMNRDGSPPEARLPERMRRCHFLAGQKRKRCENPCVPFMNHCARHVLSNVEQKMFVFCAESLCRMPVDAVQARLWDGRCHVHRENVRERFGLEPDESEEEEEEPAEEEEEEEEEEELIGLKMDGGRRFRDEVHPKMMMVERESEGEFDREDEDADEEEVEMELDDDYEAEDEGDEDEEVEEEEEEEDDDDDEDSDYV